MKDKFSAQYGDRAKTAIAFAMNTEFSRVLSDRMEFFNDDPKADQFSKVRGQLNDVKDIMMENIGRFSVLLMVVSRADLVRSIWGHTPRELVC